MGASGHLSPCLELCCLRLSPLEGALEGDELLPGDFGVVVAPRIVEEEAIAHRVIGCDAIGVVVANTVAAAFDKACCD